MKKQFTAAAVSLISVGALSAQSLFDLAPSSEDKAELPLTWTAGISFGYDDNATPLLEDDNSSLYGNLYVGASFLSRTPATTTEFFARIGVIHYFDDLDTDNLFPTGLPDNPATPLVNESLAPIDVDETSFTAGLGLNWTHRVSERLRFVSSNLLNYELEPDYSVGFQAARQTGNYLRWSTDNAVGYRWSERLATYTGVRYEDLSYDDVDDLDLSILSFYHNFRYQLSPQTVATLNYRYSTTDVDSGFDSTNHYITVGLEQRFSPTSIGTIRAGVQLRDVDGGTNGSSPFVEASLRSQMNSQFGVRAYARYGVEDYSRGFGGTVFDNTNTLRVGVTGDYRVSDSLSLNAGVNYITLGYEDARDGSGDLDEDLLNLFIGFRLELSENMWLSGTYNYEDLGSDVSAREYDRNRFSLGINATF